MIDLDRINLQYWFNGPENTPDTTDALSLFTMDCLDTTLGELWFLVLQELCNHLGSIARPEQPLSDTLPALQGAV